MDYNAESLNQHLVSGGVVQVTTCMKSWLYQPKHAGMFVQRPDGLYVKQGKRAVPLIINGCALVSIRTGRYV